jgi:hypothetical protein
MATVTPHHETQVAIGARRRHTLQRLMADVLLAGRTARCATRAERARLCHDLAAQVGEHLEPHAELDEPGLTAIRAWLDALAATSPSEVDRIQELLYGIDALVRVHIWRETGLDLEPPPSLAEV